MRRSALRGALLLPRLLACLKREKSESHFASACSLFPPENGALKKKKLGGGFVSTIQECAAAGEGAGLSRTDGIGGCGGAEGRMSGSEELAQTEEEQGGEEYEGAEDDAELAAMQKELEKAEQQKAELDKLNKMQGTASADSKQSISPQNTSLAAPPQMRACAVGRGRDAVPAPCIGNPSMRESFCRE